MIIRERKHKLSYKFQIRESNCLVKKKKQKYLAPSY